MRRVYLAGPMRGIKDFNFPAFFEAEAKLRDAGHEVFNPAASGVKEFGWVAMQSETGDAADVAHHLDMSSMKFMRHVFKIDMQWVCDHADVVALLPGWENSKGSSAEKALAEALGLEVWFLNSEGTC